MASVTVGLEATIAALDAEGRLSDVDEALLAVARGLAEAVDKEPGNASLWREYRAALASLMEAESGADDDDSQTFLVALRTPVGDTKNAKPKEPRTRYRSDSGTARSASDAVAKGGRGRRV